jgi:hypothetical protein
MIQLLKKYGTNAREKSMLLLLEQVKKTKSKIRVGGK